MTGVLIRRGNLDADKPSGRTPSEHEDRGLDDGSIGQGTPKTASKLSEARREAWNR